MSIQDFGIKRSNSSEENSPKSDYHSKHSSAILDFSVSIQTLYFKLTDTNEDKKGQGINCAIVR